jgi:protoporphyrin/coproporphyrin ferrochelatase
MMTSAVVLIAHGTVESLDDLPEFLANIRRGHPAPPELALEVRRRYEAIGGKSPLNDINRELARLLEARLNLPVRFSNRLFHPYPKDVIAKLHQEGIRKIVTVPLAQHSAGVYAEAVRAAAKEVDPAIEVLAAPNWGTRPDLTDAFADVVAEAVAKVPEPHKNNAALVLSAHSLPVAVVKAGDPYEKEFRASAEAVAAAVREKVPFAEHAIAFQSQGIGTGMEWLGPDLKATITSLKERGRTHIVVAPIGFLADHVEILYDLDIEAKAWEGELGIVLYRSTSLNTAAKLVDTLESVTRAVMTMSSAGIPSKAERQAI